MKTRYLLVLSTFAAASFAQQWGVGGGVGGSFLPAVSVSGSRESATTGFRPGVAAGAFLGQRLYKHLSGEIRYTFLQSDLKLAGGGTTATFSGNAHAVYYDVLVHTNHGESRAEIFGAIGGGMKIFRGTGKEAAYQSLSQFGYFTKAQTVKPMLSAGSGVKFKLSPRFALRTEFRDFVTPFPKELITPAPGVKFGSLLHNFVPMASISYEY